MSHDIVNEQISLMSQSVLRTLLRHMNISSTICFSIIANVVNREQFTFSITRVNDDYNIHEDPVSLFSLPDTTADTLTKVL